MAYSDEVPLEPGIIFDGLVHCCLLPAVVQNRGLADIRELRSRVVAPDNDVAHLVARHTQPVSNLENMSNANVLESSSTFFSEHGIYT